MKQLSASRLNDYLGCAHAVALWLADIKSEGETDPTLLLIREKGFQHEADVLARLEALHGPATKIPGKGPHTDRVKLTKEAMDAGAKLIYQAALSKDPWLGYPDFLVRSATEGPFYQPQDAKRCASRQRVTLSKMWRSSIGVSAQAK